MLDGSSTHARGICTLVAWCSLAAWCKAGALQGGCSAVWFTGLVQRCSVLSVAVMIISAVL